MKHKKTLLTRSFIFAMMFLFVACVATVGPSISVPEIPLGIVESNPRVSQSSIEVGQIKDSRVLDYNSTGQGLVTPEGDISRTVETGIINYLKAAGSNVSHGSSLLLQGEVKEWQAAYEGSTTGALDSKASIYIEVIDQGSKAKIYTGTFQGNRSSHFPFVSPADIKDSLGFAMAQCIQQVFKDNGVQKAITSK